MKQTKRLCSVLLALVLVISLLPALPAFAVEYDLWVAGTKVNDSNYYDVLGDGAFYYYADNQTLYVYGDCYSSSTIIKSRIPGLRICLINDAYFRSYGQYAMELAADTVITGYAELTVSADQYGVNVTDSATLEFDHTRAYIYADDRAVYGGGGVSPALKVTCSKVYTCVNDTVAVGYFSGGITLEQANITLPEGYTIIEGSVLQSDSATLAKEVLFEKNETYDLWIQGTPVTDENKNDVFGDGFFRYDDETSTLTVSGDCTNDDEVIYSALPFLKLEVEKDVTLTSKNGSAIVFYGDGKITGEGVLKAVGNASACGIFVTNYGSLTLQDAHVEASGGYGISGGGDEYLYIAYSDIKADGSYGAICDFYMIDFSFATISKPTSGFCADHFIADVHGDLATSVEIKAEVPLRVDGFFVLDDNMDDIIGNGVFAYDKDAKTLYIYGDYTAATDELIFSQVDGLTVETVNDVMLTATNSGANGFVLCADTTFTGGGQLNIEADFCGIYATNGGDLTIKDTTVVSEANAYAITGGYDNKLTISSSNVFAQVTSTNGAISDFGMIEVDRELLQFPAGGVVGSDSVYESDGTTKADMVYFVRNYGLCVGGDWVTDSNRADILYDGGSTVYYPESKLLYLSADISCTDDVINSTVDGLIIWVNQDLTLESTDYSAMALNGDTLIIGAGALTLKGDYCGLIAGNESTITISELTVNATGRYGVTGCYDERLVVDRANVVAYGSTYGAICDFADVTLKHCYLRKPVGGTISGGDVLNPDASVSLEAEIKALPTYDLIVAGEYVSDANKDDILEDGAFRYDPDTKTLTVMSDCTTDQTILWSNIDGLTVELADNATLTCTDSYNDAIYLKGDTTFTGSGKLTLNAGGRCIVITDYATLTLDALTADVTGMYGLYGFTGEALVIRDSSVTVNASDHAISGFADITLEGCTIVKPAGGKLKDGAVCNPDDSIASEVEIRKIETYELWILDQQVTELNCADVLGDGRFSYDPTAKKLTVKGDCTGSGHNPIKSYIDGLTIFVAADSRLEASFAAAIFLEGATEITGPGKLTAISDTDCGIIVLAGAKLTIRDAAVYAEGVYGICGLPSGEALMIRNSTVHAKGANAAICDFDGGIVLQDCKIVTPAGATIDGANILDGSTRATEVEISPVHTVSFDANGHGAAPAAQTVLHGAAAIEPAALTASGWIFGGWFMEAACVNKYDFSTPVTANITLYAKWTQDAAPTYYTVTFNANGHGEAPAAQMVEEGTTATEPAALTATGWIFGGWFMEAACVNKYNFSTPVTANITLYAKWTEESTPPVNPFIDVQTSDYFYDPVLWAYYHTPQITTGTSANKFSPGNNCTRAQIVTFLWRAKGCPEPSMKINPFKDVDSGQYYYEAVLWAVEKGITTGTGTDTFSPDKPCTRAQAVTFLWRAEGSPEPKTSANPFKDVAAGQYYYKAVLWAVENGITKGTGDDTFSPDSTCTRGQIVTFLYRDLAG